MQNDNQAITEKEFQLSNWGQAVNIFGDNDENLLLIESLLGVNVVMRNDKCIIKGSAEAVDTAISVLDQLAVLSRAGITITSASVNYAVNMLTKNAAADISALAETVYVTPRGKQIRAKTIGQLQYLQNIKKHDLTFGIGPAGTGKTYLAVVMAVAALKARQVSKIVLVRPAVEAGEKLGFLPGDMQEKVNPYLRPVYDALDDTLGVELAAKHMERGIIEVVPLAYMRGRTLEEAFIILDEAQNTTPPQMKMFLTRLGMGSKAVITGDVTQVDLPHGVTSGLVDAQNILKDVRGISFCYLTQVDVVRHPLVQKIIEAYDKRSNNL